MDRRVEATGLGGGLLVLLAALSGCGGEIYGGSEDIAAEAGEARLSPDQLATWMKRSPSGTPDQGVAGFVALAWVDYSLLAQAAAKTSLTDSATAAAALAPDLMLVPMRRWHDTLVSRRPRVADDRPDSLYADNDLRVFQHIFLRISDPQDVRANTVVRERAESLMVQARAPGADFAALARQHSEDATGALGGWLPPSRRSAFPPEFVRGSWRIQPGTIQGVISRGGFHVVRRPELEEVRDRLRQYAESLSTRRADSAYVDSLTSAKAFTLGTNVPARLRAFFDQPSRRTEDREPLARWDGGELLLEQAATWIDLLPPRAYMDLRGTSDVLLERFTRELAQQFIVHGEAVRNGIGVTPGEWSVLYAAYRRGLARSLRLLGADTATGQITGDREARVTELLNQLTADSTRWQSLPSALGAVLRAREGYRLHQPGLDRALRAATPPAAP
jgi:hypothetical protein